ncbi:MAG: hypothetical protein GXO48_09105 [Chlorobi bacterium]|nr:hypothetical protein [Chlorobiota bacterium]
MPKLLSKGLVAGLLVPALAIAQWHSQKVSVSLKLRDIQTQDPVIGAIMRITSPSDSELSITSFSNERGAVEVFVPSGMPLNIEISHAFYMAQVTNSEPLPIPVISRVLLIY